MMVNVQIYNHFPSYSRYFCLLHNSTPSTATPDLQWRDTLRGSIFTAAEGEHPQRSALSCQEKTNLQEKRNYTYII